MALCTESVGSNASHGVPVRAEIPVPEEKLKCQLVAPAVAKVGGADKRISALPKRTPQSFRNFHRTKANLGLQDRRPMRRARPRLGDRGQKTNSKARTFDYRCNLLH